MFRQQATAQHSDNKLSACWRTATATGTTSQNALSGGVLDYKIPCKQQRVALCGITKQRFIYKLGDIIQIVKCHASVRIVRNPVPVSGELEAWIYRRIGSTCQSLSLQLLLDMLKNLLLEVNNRFCKNLISIVGLRKTKSALPTPLVYFRRYAEQSPWLKVDAYRF